MTANLWSSNSPWNFWQCAHPFSDDLWKEAIERTTPVLQLKQSQPDINMILELALGEGQFGQDHWTLSPIKRLYYLLKPLLPRTLTRLLRQLLNKRFTRDFALNWPSETRYLRFQFAVLKNLLELSRQPFIHIRALWPQGNRYAFVLTHDIESAEGQRFVRCVADLEENLGFRSSFNFVPEDYAVDMALVDELRQRGFEIGIHGLKHDGKLFDSHRKFMQHAGRINLYLQQFGAVGFRAPLTHRQPQWMQALDIEYDLSFFDTDPFEPIPGGTMSIWPFFIGHFVELPYTLVQDYTLTSVLGETTPQIWLEKVELIREYHGMALVNSHPDYLINQTTWNVYAQFLNSMKERSDYWHALPRQVSKWWQERTERTDCGAEPSVNENDHAVASIKNGVLELGVTA